MLVSFGNLVWPWEMTQAEIARLVFGLGFLAFGVLVCLLTYLYVEKGVNGRRLVICYGGLFLLLVGISLTGLLTQTPFEILRPPAPANPVTGAPAYLGEAVYVNAAIMCLVLSAVIVGVWRRG
jgi:hypothetical protein